MHHVCHGCGPSVIGVRNFLGKSKPDAVLKIYPLALDLCSKDVLEHPRLEGQKSDLTHAKEHLHIQ